jgi:hypothetical protein
MRDMKKQIIVNDAVVLDGVEKHSGLVHEFYTAKMRINGQKPINVTYDCEKANIMIHEWYNVNPKALDAVSKMLKNCFMRLMVQELYPAATASMDKYNNAVGMGFPEHHIETLELNMSYLLGKIEKAGMMADFRQYALMD